MRVVVRWKLPQHLCDQQRRWTVNHLLWTAFAAGWCRLCRVRRCAAAN